MGVSKRGCGDADMRVLNVQEERTSVSLLIELNEKNSHC